MQKVEIGLVLKIKFTPRRYFCQAAVIIF